MTLNQNLDFLSNKRILITGNTGFKGSWLTKVLSLYSKNLFGISIDIPTKPSLYKILNLKKKLKKQFIFDIANYTKFKNAINIIKPQIIFHLAAQSLVIKGYKFPYQTFHSNILGTLNLLEILKKKKFKIPIVIVTTDKVYETRKKKSFSETDLLNASDPYGSSKVSAEILVNCYIKSYLNKRKFCNVAVARSGNVVGGGDYSQDRLVPDFFRSIKVYLRNPEQIRPWQHVLEPTFGYILLAKYVFKKKMNTNEYAWNFGPSKKNFIKVKKIISLLKSQFPTKKIIIKKKNYKETDVLMLNSNKALKYLKWKQKLSIKNTINYIAEYYSSKKNLDKIVESQIKRYMHNFFK